MTSSPLRWTVRLLTVLTAAAAVGTVVVFADGPAATGGARIEAFGTAATIGLRVDRVSALLLLLVVFLALVAAGFASRQLDDVPARRFAGRLLLCVAALAATVTAASLPVFAIGWTIAALAVAALVEVTDDPRARAAAATVRRRLLLGDAFLWAGVVVAAIVFADLDRTAAARVVAGADDAEVLLVAGLLAVAGAARSALVPFHRWLPETTAAPTPVSAQLHGGFVNGLGVLGVLWWPLFAGSAPVRAGLVIVGVATALVATAQMRARSDIKGRLVSSTSAQMGYMSIELGAGIPAAALLHLLGHGGYKAALFLGSGSTVRPGPRTPARHGAGLAPWLGAAALALALVVGASILGFPATGLAAVVLLGAAWVTITVALAPVLASGRPWSHRVALALAVLLLAASALVAVAWFKDVMTRSFPASGSWSGGGALALGLIVVGAAVAALAVDRAVRAGRWGRVSAWARRAALPPRASRRALGVRVSPIAASAPVLPADRAVTRALVEEAARVVAPSYPLTAFVASNPLARLEALPVEDALRRVIASRDEVDVSGFGPLSGGASLTDGELVAALGTHGDLLPVMRAHERGAGPTAELVGAAAVALRRAHVRPVRATTPGELVDLACGTAVVEHARDEAALWCAAWADSEVSAWPVRRAESGLWATWRRAALPGADRALGAPGFAAAAAALPERADEAVHALLEAMAVPAGDRAAVLARALGRLSGWAAHLAWRVTRCHDDGAQPAELLAVLLASEQLLADAVARAQLGCPGRIPDLEQALAARGIDPHERALAATAHDLAVGAAALGLDGDALLRGDSPAVDATVARLLAFDPVERSLTLARAVEERDREPLLRAIADTATTSATRPIGPVDAQVVCCIDVRSERLRRNLEATGAVETFGFAGFFGVPFHYLPPGAGTGIDQCPVLVSPRNTVGESPRDGSARRFRTGLGRRSDAAAARDAGHSVETEPVAPFALAESLGALLAAGAAARTFAPVTSSTVVRPARVLAGRIDLDGPAGFTVDERTYLAEAALRTFGLTRDLSPLVLLCGHDASTVNNPFGTAYKCGACGGQGGAPNARALAAILNDATVRAQLADRGIDVPPTTRFVAGVHDTTTDRVTILDRDDVPAPWRDPLARLETQLDAAAGATAVERWTRRPGLPRTPGDPAAARRASMRRASDWAEVRPEWGLAGNLAFVVAPRTLTAPLDLDGQVFLHSYEWEHDRDGAALEVILTAPLVVGEWISTQYWCSAAVPETFGAGDKALHNVVGGFGVLTGPRGDLRIGLPRQAVYAADGARVHEPRRLLALVRAPRALVDAIVRRTPVLTDFVDHGWIDLATIDPDTGAVERRARSGQWEPWTPTEPPSTPPPSHQRDDSAIHPLTDEHEVRT